VTDDNLPAGSIVWVFGDQLNRRIGALGMARPETHRILFVEATEQITGRRYHRQRLHLVLAGCAA
jgi:(6-4)DNA photolyase